MKSSTLRFALVLLAVTVALAACRRGESAAPGTTETIAPAAPQPQPTGTDAMTQTVDIEDGRSEAEGGALNNPTTAATSTTSTAPTTTATAPEVPAVSPPPATKTTTR